METLWDLNRKPHLLFIEDDIDYLNMFRIYFQGLGAEVAIATQATEGLQLYSTHLFDLVVLDLGLPGFDEYEFIRSIRRSGNKVPVIFLTRKDGLSDKLLGLETDADDYMIKPFDIEELKLRVKRGLRYRKNYLK